MKSLGINSTISLLIDNQSTISMIKNELNPSSRHILIRMKFVQDIIDEFNINIVYCEGKLQRADLLTKELNKCEGVGGVLRNATTLGSNHDCQVDK